MINHFLKAAGLAPVERSVSRPLAFAAAGLLELAYVLSRQEQEPPMTRFLARQLSTTHWFNIDAARRDLGLRASRQHRRRTGTARTVAQARSGR